MSDTLPPLSSSDVPPEAISEMTALKDYLDNAIPRKRDTFRNLLIATWNLKDFGSLTESWKADSTVTPRRDWRALWAITEIISRFDVVALQEVTGNLKALRTLLKTLGEDWQFLMTDINARQGGDERLAFLFDVRRVRLSGLACELVIPPDESPGRKIEASTLQKQFVRTPYAIGFQAGAETFVLVTLHVIFGKGKVGRSEELKAIARWMADWAKKVNDWEQNLIVLGDFNIDNPASPLWKAFTETGLIIPAILKQALRSIFAGQSNFDKYYDQIAWFEDRLHLKCTNGGYVSFLERIYKGFPPDDVQYRISDHYPLWVEFACRNKYEIDFARAERGQAAEPQKMPASMPAVST
jgi:endonuclease/exonuclease/phosphatase family metal-dependent hydrolase